MGTTFLAPHRRSPKGRQTVLWIDEGVDDELAASLRRAGVTQVVVRRGTVNLTSATPVLRIVDGPEVAGEIPVAPALHLETGDRALDGDTAETLWRGLSPALAGTPAELLLDMPRLPEGCDAFIAGLRASSGLDVVPILTVEQVNTPEAWLLRGLQGSASFRFLGRVAVGCAAPARRPTSRWQIGCDHFSAVASACARQSSSGRRPYRLCGGGGKEWARCARAKTPSFALLPPSVASFPFAEKWSGATARGRWARRWTSVGWTRLGCIRPSQDIDHLLLPDVVGWDLVSLPPAGDALGINREGLLEYLMGRGPGPELVVVPERTGRSLRVTVSNASPFSSAVSKSGHWLEVAMAGGALAARDKGDFDAITLGSRRRGQWQQGVGSGADAVRFGEVFIGPGEKMRTGVIRLPSSRSELTIRWRVVLSNGEVVEGISGS